MTNPARIVFAIPELDAAGPDRVMYELLSRIDRNRFEPILVVSNAGGRYFDLLSDNMQIDCIGGNRYPVWRFARAIDRLRPDIVFTTLRMNVTAAMASYLQRSRPSLIVRQANAIAADFTQLRKKSLIKHRIAEFLVRFLLKRPDVLVAQSQDMVQELIKYARPGQEIVTIGNPISLDEVNSTLALQTASSTPKPWGSPALVTAGRLSAQKGFDLLLPAVKQLREQYPNARLTIWGEGPDRAALEAQVDELGLVGAVRMPGRIENIFSEIASADIFVSSSRYEGFSNAILEAMALGTVVVATNSVGATNELVLDGQTGILSPEINSVGIHMALVRALESDLSPIAVAARQHVKDNFDKSAIADQYSRLFEHHIGKTDSVVCTQ